MSASFLDALKPRMEIDPKLQAAYAEASVSTFDKVKSVTVIPSDCVKNVDPLNNIAKTGKNTAQYVVALTGNLSAKDIVSHCDGISNTIKVFGFFKGIHSLIERLAEEVKSGIDFHIRNLGIFSALLQIFASGTAFVKLLDKFGLIKIAEISSSLGTTAVLPFSVFASSLDLFKCGIEVGLNSLKVHKANNKLDTLKTKLNNTRVNNTDLNNFFKDDPKKNPNLFNKIETFFETHIKKIKDKQRNAKLEIINLQVKVKETRTAVKTARKAYLEEENKPIGEGLIEKTINAWKKRSAQEALFEAHKAHDKAYNSCKHLSNRYIRRIEKQTVWKGQRELFNNADHGKQLKVVMDVDGNYSLDKTDSVNKLFDAEQNKWEHRENNANNEKSKSAINIFINCAVAVALIATIVLTLTGIAVLAAAMTITTLYLVVALTSLVNGHLGRKDGFFSSTKVTDIDYKQVLFTPIGQAGRLQLP